MKKAILESFGILSYINNDDGDITAININDEEKRVTLRGVAGSTNCFYDNVQALPKGKYILLRAIETITIE